LKWANPDAHLVNEGEGETMQAYYDEKLKVWVFPGEDPAELSKPLGPPPTAATEVKPSPAPLVKQEAINDPLAALMAVPQRAPPGRSARSAVTTPGRFPPMSGLAKDATPQISTPQFAVFQPKPSALASETKSSPGNGDPPSESMPPGMGEGAPPN
jgi:hypothetical protein